MKKKKKNEGKKVEIFCNWRAVGISKGGILQPRLLRLVVRNKAAACGGEANFRGIFSWAA